MHMNPQHPVQLGRSAKTLGAGQKWARPFQAKFLHPLNPDAAVLPTFALQSRPRPSHLPAAASAQFPADPEADVEPGSSRPAEG